jgi:hypothetical protein
MNEAVRMENKRRQELRALLEKQRQARLAQPKPVLNPQKPHTYHIGHGTKRDVVLDFIRDGGLYTIPEIGNTLGFKHTSVAALIRDLRKPQNGSHTIDVIRIDGDHYFQFVR